MVPRPHRASLSCALALDTGKGLEPSTRPTWVLTREQEKVQACSLAVRSMDKNIDRGKHLSMQLPKGHMSSRRDFSISLRLKVGRL